MRLRMEAVVFIAPPLFYVDFFSITTILYFTCYTEYVHIKD